MESWISRRCSHLGQSSAADLISADLEPDPAPTTGRTTLDKEGSTEALLQNIDALLTSLPQDLDSLRQELDILLGDDDGTFGTPDIEAHVIRSIKTWHKLKY